MLTHKKNWIRASENYEKICLSKYTIFLNLVFGQVGEKKLRQRLLYQARKVIGHVKIVLGVSILHLSMILDFGTVLTVWYFLFFI
jgi:hypothetical protein